MSREDVRRGSSQSRGNGNRSSQSQRNGSRSVKSQGNHYRSPQNQGKRRVNKKKKRKRKIILFALEIIVLLILLLLVFVWLKLGKIDVNKLNESKMIINDLKSDDGYTSIAIFGLDNRSNGKLSRGNSDVIMIASINDETKEVKLCSVFRDTYLDRGNESYGKANAAYSKGGPEQAISMLNKNLDLGIKKYVTVDFNAVTSCVDAIGGVELDITEDELQWINSYIETTADVTGATPKFISKTGKQLCDGTQATAYARIRYTTGDDFKRAERQRIVIEQMFSKAKTSNIAKINKVIDSLFDEVSTNLTQREILALASAAFEYQMGETAGFPFEKDTDTLGKMGSCVIPCDLVSNLTQLHEYLYNDKKYQPSATVQGINDKIINDTGKRQGDGY